MSVPDHYEQVLEELREDLPILQAKALSPEKDGEGKFTAAVSSTLRMIGAIAYVVEHDASAFRANLADAAKLRTSLFDRFDAGDPISPSYVSMFAYKALLDALASGDLAVARALAERIGGRPDIERTYDRDFERSIGYALKAILLGDDRAAIARLDELERAVATKDYKNFAAYVPVLRAIVRRDGDAGGASFLELMAGHRREAKGRGLFNGAVDAVLSVWGIGLINLAAFRGIALQVADPLVPPELIVGISD